MESHGRTLSSTEAAFFGRYLDIPDGGIHIFGDRPLLRKLEIRRGLHCDECQPELQNVGIRQGAVSPNACIRECIASESRRQCVSVCLHFDTHIAFHFVPTTYVFRYIFSPL